MTNFIVNSPQTLLTGTTGNDLFQIQTGLAGSVFGIEGNDEFSATVSASNFNQTVFNGGGGNDTIRLTANSGAGSATLLSILGGGGDDVITAQISGSADRVIFQGGGGNDTIDIFLAAAVSTGITINGNGGDDAVSASLSSVTKSLVALGGGTDTLDLTNAQGITGTTIIGGGGNDDLTLNAISGSGIVIAADTDKVQSEFDGNDTIFAEVTAAIASLIQGNGGNDDIFLLGLDDATTIGGNAGNDTISLGNVAGAARFQLNAGAGNDLIAVQFSAGNQDASINGGGGADTIGLTATSVTSTAFLFGDAEADLFNLGGTGIASAASLAFLSYSNAADSNLSATDNVSAAGSGFAIANLYQNIATGVVTSQGTNIVTNTAGGVTFSNTFTLGVTARASALDSLSTTAGGVYFFADGVGKSYVFVQGGAAGTSDDLLVANATTGASAISAVTVAGRGAGLLGGTIGVAF